MKYIGLLFITAALGKHQVERDFTYANTDSLDVDIIAQDEYGQITQDHPNQLEELVDDIGTITVLDEEDIDEPEGRRRLRSVAPRQLSVQNTALNAHNKARSTQNVPCTSADMQKLTWDKDLANAAQKYAEKCIWRHNSDRPKGSGENLYVQYSSRPLTVSNTIIANGIQSWMNERQYYDFDNTKCKKPPCGHYTQVVWSKTSKVGCGAALCKEGLEGGIGYMNGIIVVCNYNPGGNMLGSKPYIEGEQCALCPDNCVDGLCVKTPDTFKACKDFNNYKYNWNGKQHEGCDALIKSAGKSVCADWPVIGKTYCRRKCGTCSDADNPFGIGKKYCGKQGSHEDGGNDEPVNEEPSDDSGNSEEEQEETKPEKQCSDFGKKEKKLCKNHKNAQGQKICKFKKKKCIPKGRRLLDGEIESDDEDFDEE